MATRRRVGRSSRDDRPQGREWSSDEGVLPGLSSRAVHRATVQGVHAPARTGPRRRESRVSPSRRDGCRQPGSGRVAWLTRRGCAWAATRTIYAAHCRLSALGTGSRRRPWDGMNRRSHGGGANVRTPAPATRPGRRRYAGAPARRPVAIWTRLVRPSRRRICSTCLAVVPGVDHQISRAICSVGEAGGDHARDLPFGDAAGPRPLARAASRVASSAASRDDAPRRARRGGATRADPAATASTMPDRGR